MSKPVENTRNNSCEQCQYWAGSRCPKIRQKSNLVLTGGFSYHTSGSSSHRVV